MGLCLSRCAAMPYVEGREVRCWQVPSGMGLWALLWRLALAKLEHGPLDACFHSDSVYKLDLRRGKGPRVHSAAGKGEATRLLSRALHACTCCFWGTEARLHCRPVQNILSSPNYNLPGTGIIFPASMQHPAE